MNTQKGTHDSYHPFLFLPSSLILASDMMSLLHVSVSIKIPFGYRLFIVLGGVLRREETGRPEDTPGLGRKPGAPVKRPPSRPNWRLHGAHQGRRLIARTRWPKTHLPHLMKIYFNKPNSISILNKGSTIINTNKKYQIRLLQFPNFYSKRSEDRRINSIFFFLLNLERGGK